MSGNPFVFQGAITGGEPAPSLSNGLALSLSNGQGRESPADGGQGREACLWDVPAVDRIVNDLLLGKYYTLLGPRLSGITSLVRELLRVARLREEHCQYIYVNLQRVTAGTEEASLFRGIGAACEAWPAEIAPALATVDGADAFRSALWDIVRGRPTRLIVALDDLDAGSLSFNSVKMLVRWARVLFNLRLSDPEYGKISVLIGGSQNPYELSTGSGSPFNIAERHWLRDLTPDGVRQLIRAGEELGAPHFDEAAVARIVVATSGDKYFVQRICHMCVEEVGAAEQSVACAAEVTEEIADGVIARLVRMDHRRDACFAPLIRNLTTDPDLVEIIVDLLGGRDAFPSEYQADVNRVLLGGLLKVQDGRYCFRNEVYRRFLEDPSTREMVRQMWVLHDQARELTRLHEATLSIASMFDPRVAPEQAAWTVLRASRADVVAFYLLDRASRFSLNAVARSDETYPVQPVLARDDIAKDVVASGKTALAEEWAFAGAPGSGFAGSCMWLPLSRGGEVIGTMVIAFKERRTIPLSEIKAAEIMASHVAAAVIRHRLADTLQRAGAMDIASVAREKVPWEIASYAQDILGVSAALVWGFANGGQELRVIAHAGKVRDNLVREWRLRTDVEPMRAFLLRDNPFHIRDIVKNPYYQGKAAARQMRWRSLLTIPMKANGRPVGIIEAYTDREWRVTPWQRAFLKLLAGQAGMAVENARLYGHLEEDKALLSRLYGISTKLRTSLDLRDVLDTITASLRDTFHLATCTVGLLDEAERRLDFVAHLGLAGPTTRLVADLPPELWDHVRIQGKFYFSDDVPGDPYLPKVLERQDLQSFIILPLQGKERFLGVLTMGSTGRLALEESADWDVLTALMDQAAVAIENAQLYQQLEQARRVQDDSLKVLTHQIRAEPGFVTNTITTLLAGRLGDLSALQRDRLAKAQRRLDDYHRLVDSITLYGRLKGGKLSPRLEPVDLAQLIRGVITSRRAEAKRAGLVLQTRVRKLPVVELDRGMIETVVANLLDNAIKFTPAGGTIAVTARTDLQDVHIAVDDTGPGIPPAERERVFDEYYQLGPEPSRAQEGAGLGLYIARRFVQMHGGRIGVVEKDGPGTRIEVTLPTHQEDHHVEATGHR